MSKPLTDRQGATEIVASAAELSYVERLVVGSNVTPLTLNGFSEV